MNLDNIKKSKIVVFAIITGLINLLVSSNKMPLMSIGFNSINNFVFLEFGYLHKYVLLIIRWITPQLICMLLYYDYISQIFTYNGSLIFTRVNKRLKYYFIIITKLFVNISIFLVVQLIPLFLTNLHINLELFNLKAYLAYTIYIYMILLVVNILNIIIGINYSIFLTCLVQTISIMTLNFVIKSGVKFIWIFRFNPFTAIFFNEVNSSMLDSYSINSSINIMIIFIIAIILFSSIYINKMDLIGE